MGGGSEQGLAARLAVHSDSDFPIDGRDLHDRLGVDTPYRIWFPRMCEYGFVEGVDFNPYKNVRVQTEGERDVSREVLSHSLTLSMAKEICMLQRTDTGKAIRRYLIEVEKAWNSPEQIMSRALRIADATIAKLRNTNLQLSADVSRLTVEKQIMAPKADYFDELVDRNLLTSFRETAKQLGVPERAFVRWLIEKKYIYRDQKGKLMPYAGKHADLFETKECKNDKTKWAGTQTLVTPKGRETFRLLTKGLDFGK